MFWRKTPIDDFIPGPVPHSVFYLRETPEGTILHLCQEHANGNTPLPAIHIERLLAFAKGVVRRHEPPCNLTGGIAYDSDNTISLSGYYFTPEGTRCCVLFAGVTCGPQVFYEEPNTHISEPNRQNKLPDSIIS